MRVLVVLLSVLSVFILWGEPSIAHAQKGLKGRLCVNNDDGQIIIRKRCRRSETELDTQALQALVLGAEEEEEGNTGALSAAVEDYQRVSKLNSCSAGLFGDICSATATCPAGTFVLGGGVSSTKQKVHDSRPIGDNKWYAEIDVPSLQTAEVNAYAICGKATPPKEEE